MPKTILHAENHPTQVPHVLACEVAELRKEFSDFAKNRKYKKYLREYENWNGDELLSRLRILCTEARANAYEIVAIGDLLEVSSD